MAKPKRTGSGKAPGRKGKDSSAPRGRRRAREKKEDPPAPSPGPRFGPDTRHYADAGIFLVLMIIGGILAYTLIPISFAQEGANAAQDLADLTTNTNQVLLGSTVPDCVYTDTQQVRTEYHNEPVYYLLMEDIYIRTEGKRDLNLGSLRGSLEKNVAELAQRLLIEDHGFLIQVTTTEQDAFVIVKTSKEADTVFDADPLDNAVQNILGTKDDSAFNVRSEYSLRNQMTCTITFAMFKTAETDLGGLKGGTTV